MMPALQMSTSSRLCSLLKALAKLLTDSSDAKSSSLTSISCTLSDCPIFRAIACSHRAFAHTSALPVLGCR